LFQGTIDQLEAPKRPFDVMLSVSALEHFPDAHLVAAARAVKRLLKPDGVVVMTVDLFLDLKPFSNRERNEWGRNIDLKNFLHQAGLELEEGNVAELFGFPEFDLAVIMGRLATYFVGQYPTLSQCLSARPHG
jgi:SAM-dependent methyltransferase